MPLVEYRYDGSLEGLLELLEKVLNGEPLPGRVRNERYSLLAAQNCSQIELFDSPQDAPRDGKEIALSGAVFTRRILELFEGQSFSDLPSAGEMRGPWLLREASASAWDDFIHGWMSELPIEAELLAFGTKVIGAAERLRNNAPGKKGPETGTEESGSVRREYFTHETRLAAEKARTDRGDPAVRTVLAAAYKVRREVHRLTGLLRFSPGTEDIHIAHCAPDHFVLPALARHFGLRFGEIPWIIMDEKRNCCLSGGNGRGTELLPWHAAASKENPAAACNGDAGEHGPKELWEGLWKEYHKTINIESRKNGEVQRRFMPERYWKYLPEMKDRTEDGDFCNL